MFGRDKRKARQARHDELMGAVADMQRMYGVDPDNVPSMADVMKSAMTGGPVPGFQTPPMPAATTPCAPLTGPDPLDALIDLADRFEADQVDEATFLAERQRLLSLL